MPVRFCWNCDASRRPVAETGAHIFMVETKARTDVEAQEVAAKASAAAQRCRHASDHAKTVGGKPWAYVLLPHDEVKESSRLVDYMRFQAKPLGVQHP